MGIMKRTVREEMVRPEQPRGWWIDLKGSENLDGKEVTTLISLTSDEIQRFIRDECRQQLNV
jgi:hypothetical protein